MTGSLNTPSAFSCQENIRYKFQVRQGEKYVSLPGFRSFDS